MHLTQRDELILRKKHAGGWIWTRAMPSNSNFLLRSTICAISPHKYVLGGGIAGLDWTKCGCGWAMCASCGRQAGLAGSVAAVINYLYQIFFFVVVDQPTSKEHMKWTWSRVYQAFCCHNTFPATATAATKYSMIRESIRINSNYKKRTG